MTLSELNKICKENNIPEDVRLLSNSGWEWGPTEMDSIFYSEQQNIIVFGQFEEEYIAKVEDNPEFWNTTHRLKKLK